MLLSLKKNSLLKHFSMLNNTIFPVLYIYLAISVLSLTAAINPITGIIEVSKIILSICILFIAATLISKDKNGLHILIKSVTLGALLLSTIGIYRYIVISINTNPYNPVFIPIIANINIFSTSIFLTLPFIFFAFLNYTGKWKLLSGISMAFVFYNIINAHTRSVWVASVVATISTGLLLSYIQKKRPSTIANSISFRRLSHIGLILITIILISIPISDRLYPDYSMLDRVKSIADPADNSVSERLKIWKKSLLMIRDNPLLGVGIGNWKISIPSYGTEGLRSETGDSHYQRPHNDFIWVLSETGIIGFLLYLSIFGMIFRYLYKILLSSENKEDSLFSILIFFGITGYLTFSFFSFPKERLIHSIYLMLMIAGILSIYHSKISPRNKELNFARSITYGITMLILLFFSSLLGYTRLKSEIHTHKAIAAHLSANWEDVISEIDMAESWLYKMDPMATPISWYKGVAYFSLNRIDEALIEFKTAYAIHPYHVHVLNNLATCYESLGYHKKAVEYYRKALTVSPNFEESIVNLGAVFYNMGMYEEAYDTMLLSQSKFFNEKYYRYLDKIKNRVELEEQLSNQL